MMAVQQTATTLASLSAELAATVERVAPSVVRVDDGSRLTASGLVWSADGLILTSSHGVERDEELAVELADGGRHAATLVGRDPEIDLALLRIGASGLPAVATADPDGVRVGHLALALGRPGRAGLQATIGIVSARHDTERQGQAGYILHTDAVLYPGFSGGALVNVTGELLGITNLMFGRGRGVAVGAPVARQVAEALLAHGKVQRSFLGVTTQPVPLPESLAGKLKPRQERAVLVLQVQPGSTADRGGLLLGDILLRLDEATVEDVDDLRAALRRLPPGREVTLRVLRGGEARDLKVTLGGE